MIRLKVSNERWVQPVIMFKTITFSLVIALAVLAVGKAQAQPATEPFSAADRAAIYRQLQRDEIPTQLPLSMLDDGTLTAMTLRYAKKELGQRLSPRSIEPMWAIQPAHVDVTPDYEEARKAGRLQAWLAGLEPPFAAYRALQGVYRHYAKIVDGGGWRALPGGKALKLGTRSAVIEALRARLAIEGYVAPPTPSPDLFDEGLAHIVSTFQQRHGLTADGAVGPATLKALNVSAEDRLAQIEANLERWRWLPHTLPDDRVEVDSGMAEARLYQKGALTLTMRAVVGKPTTRTPMFASQIESVIFNPPWNVPSEITAKEILPHAARDPGYLAREGFVRTANGLQQLPGPKNALGRIKFDLPSPFGVYLHDTPAKTAFDRDMRALSHGCMRLQKPRELAQAALSWTGDQVEAAVSAGDTRRVPLPRPLPLLVVHTTAFAGPDGEANFRADIYGWDRKLSAALAGTDRVQVAASEHHATDCAA